MKLFIDCEFTGLHQKTTLISLALVAEDDRCFYAEFGDYDTEQVTPWIQENVIKHLRFEGGTYPYYAQDKETMIYHDTEGIKAALRDWLKQFDGVVIVGDVLGYDWVLFCELFGGALNLPKNVYYIPQDLATMLSVNGIDPDSNREYLAGEVEESVKHRSLWDAKIIKKIYETLTK